MSRSGCFDPDQDVHAVAQRAAQSVDRRRTLHRPAFDNQRRDRVDLIGTDEANDTLNRGRFARNGQADPWVRPPAARPAS